MTSVSQVFDGAYNLVFLDAMHRMFVARDPLGFRPLSWAVQGRLFAAASESMALMNLGFSDISGAAAGGNGRGRRQHDARALRPARRRARCFFEWVYSPTRSVIDDVPVHGARTRFGQFLAEAEDQPLDRGLRRRAGAGYRAHHRQCLCPPPGLPYSEGLSATGTWATPHPAAKYPRREREEQIYPAIHALLQGKRVFILEAPSCAAPHCSRFIRQLREIGGVKEVRHPRLPARPSSPPASGSTLSTCHELFAPRFARRATPACPPRRCWRAWRAAVGHRQPALPGSGSRISPPACRQGIDTLCTSCVTGHYPTPCGQHLAEEALCGTGQRLEAAAELSSGRSEQ